jgi:GNAT superfamily N-acetyltransferase
MVGKYITLNTENLAAEHICCAMVGGKNDVGLTAKKAWLNQRMNEGLVFRKLDARGKIFVEYLPAESCWHPIDAPNYYAINCLWVSGSFKGKGHAADLIQSCIEDAKKAGKAGVVVISSDKKRPFLTDKSFFEKYGFKTVDTAPPYFELLTLTIDPKKKIKAPQFLPQTKSSTSDIKEGYIIYYSDQCPYTSFYAELLKTHISAKKGKCQLVHYQSKEEARAGPSPFSTTSMYYNGKFLTHELLLPQKFDKLFGSLT